MKTITQTIDYVLFKPTEGSGEYFFVRSFNHLIKKFSWIMGYVNHFGGVSGVGGELSIELTTQLEEEYQEAIKQKIGNTCGE